MIFLYPFIRAPVKGIIACAAVVKIYISFLQLFAQLKAFALRSSISITIKYAFTLKVKRKNAAHTQNRLQFLRFTRYFININHRLIDCCTHTNSKIVYAKKYIII